MKGANAADNDYLKDEELIVTHIETGEINGGLPPRVRASTTFDVVNNEIHEVKDTLVIRDRAVVFEEFKIELNEK